MKKVSLFSVRPDTVVRVRAASRFFRPLSATRVPRPTGLFQGNQPVAARPARLSGLWHGCCCIQKRVVDSLSFVVGCSALLFIFRMLGNLGPVSRRYVYDRLAWVSRPLLTKKRNRSARRPAPLYVLAGRFCFWGGVSDKRPWRGTQNYA